MISKANDRQKIVSSRDDYLRSELNDYDVILVNKNWKVLPRLAFIKGHGPMFLSCKKHHDGYKQNYIYHKRVSVTYYQEDIVTNFVILS